MERELLDIEAVLKDMCARWDGSSAIKGEYKAVKKTIRRVLKGKKVEVRACLPEAYLRRWFVADLRLAARRRRPTSTLSYIQHALGMIGASKIRRIIKEGHSESLKITTSDLEKGDIILSYKTKGFLDKEFLSKLIAIAAYTSITHSSVVCEDKTGELKKLTSYAKTRGLAAIDLIPEKGEVFFVLSPHPDFRKTSELKEHVDEWYERSLLKHEPGVGKKLRFSELKCWSACMSGLIFTTTMRYVGSYVVVPNPLWRSGGYYCSEIMDIMFKKVGVTLVPRAKRAALLGPSDLLYSPHLVFKGLIGTTEDLALLKKEKLIM